MRRRGCWADLGCQTKGAVEAFHRLVLEECWRPAFPPLQLRFTGLKRDLDRYIDAWPAFRRAMPNRVGGEPTALPARIARAILAASEQRSPEMILVAGATGNVGGGVCEALRAQDKPVRAMVRQTSDRERVRHLEQLGAEIVHGELRDPGSLAHACRGVATVVSAATTIAALGTDSISAVDRDGQQALVDAAREAGVGHFIYVSYTRNVDTDDPLTEAKRAVEEHLRASGMPYTILRPSYFMEMWLGPALGWDFAAGTAQLLGSGEQRVSWISAGDVVRAIVACVDNRQAQGQTIELGGPEALSPLAVTRLAESITGRPLTIERVPAEELERQAQAAAGTDAAIFPSLMLCQTHGDEIPAAPQWLRPQTTVEDYLRGLLN